MKKLLGILVVTLTLLGAGCRTGLEEPTYAAELSVSGNGTAGVVIKADGHLILSREDAVLPFKHNLSKDYNSILLLATGTDLTCVIVVRQAEVTRQTGDNPVCDWKAGKS